MKITYLGTAAAEGLPALFCNCEFCKKARELGGKNIRTRSQAIIDDGLLIDFPADTYMHALNNKLRLDKVHTLIVTHSHSDHFYSKDLIMRQPPYGHAFEVNTLHVYCTKGAYERFVREINGEEPYGSIEFHILKAFEPFTTNGYTITPLPARHQFSEDAFIFIIEKDGKRIFYANDTGYFYDKVWDYIKTNKIYFDLVSYDCTNVEIPISDEGTHMGFENIARTKNLLEKMGAVDKKTIQIVHHFSHNGNPLHDNLERLAKPLDMLVSYDGMAIEI